ncbi:DNA polymerase III subunit alpha [Clarias magur]|uniref:DNA polymerase III subunit alpha n=1 Tax=Clarias magur TaxID=1594786 RepID=A0A8J4V2C2_CLAMG|nr:DNA polymerase III subunit alpha [Clarias magur]
MDGAFSLSLPPLHQHLMLRECSLTPEHKFTFEPGVATFYLTHCPTALGGVEALVKWLWSLGGSVPDVLRGASALSGVLVYRHSV